LGLVSFDNYPVTTDGVRDHFYANLEDVRNESMRAGVPFWAFSLSTAHGSYPVATRAAMRLQIFTTLAYGAQGIQYFTYTSPGTEEWDFHNAPINHNSQRTEVYDRVKELNHEVQAKAWVFLGAEVTDVAHTGEVLPPHTKPLTTLPAQIKCVESQGEGVIVSQMRNGADRFLMVVNRDITAQQKVKIECTPEVERIMADGSTIKASVYSPELFIEPGDMLLFRWKEVAK